MKDEDDEFEEIRGFLEAVKKSIIEFEFKKGETIKIFADFLGSSEFKSFAKRPNNLSIDENEPDVVNLRETDEGKQVTIAMQKLAKAWSRCSNIAMQYTFDIMEKQLETQSISLFLDIMDDMRKEKDADFFNIFLDRLHGYAQKINTKIMMQCFKELKQDVSKSNANLMEVNQTIH